MLDSGLQFDKEKHSTLSATMARHILGVLSIMQVNLEYYEPKSSCCAS